MVTRNGRHCSAQRHFQFPVPGNLLVDGASGAAPRAELEHKCAGTMEFLNNVLQRRSTSLSSLRLLMRGLSMETIKFQNKT